MTIAGKLKKKNINVAKTLQYSQSTKTIFYELLQSTKLHKDSSKYSPFVFHRKKNKTTCRFETWGLNK